MHTYEDRPASVLRPLPAAQKHSSDSLGLGPGSSFFWIRMDKMTPHICRVTSGEKTKGKIKDAL